MAGAGLVEVFRGVAANRKSLESIATPLSAARTSDRQYGYPEGLVPTT